MQTGFKKSIDFNGEQLTFEIDKLAPRADTSVWAQIGETVVFTVITVSKENSTLDYFPLGIEYIEKFYAGGRISGSRFVKRERWPSDDAVLKARQVDHSIRSLFPEDFKREVNIAINVLSYDGVHDPEALAVTSVSLGLMNSTIPYSGPCASVIVGIKDDKFILNPENGESEEHLDSEFIVSVREGKRILNIEGFGDEVPEEKMSELLDFAVESCEPLINMQKDISKEIGKEKLTYEKQEVSEDVVKEIKDNYLEKVKESLFNQEERDEIQVGIRQEVEEKLVTEESEISKSDVAEALDYVAKKVTRKELLENGSRTSGRELTEIRPLTIAVGVLPRVHGSGLFQRGNTQCLSVLTLGSTRLMQQLESFEGEGQKTWMHHYNGPRYSLGITGRFGFIPGRREIGHGNIGENALKKMLPDLEEFPYTIRVVSEIMSQQGSSSMAAATGATLALMDAGVQIKAPVAGISIGLVTTDDEKDFKLLTDIEDVEDFYGDMDFKVTGTTEGVTAIQLDNKIMGVPVEILKEAFKQSKIARLEILEEISKVIVKPRTDLSEFAPKFEIVKVNPEKIGEIIGPGGKMIRKIVEEAGGEVEIDIQEDGQVNITGLSTEARDIAKKMIESIVEEPELNKVYLGEIASVKEYGAFVDVSSNITGLIHKSEMSNEFVSDPGKIVKSGQKVKVKLIKMEHGKLSFTMKDVEQPV